MRHKPPAPRKVGRPEAADRPAPHRARMRLDAWRCFEKDSRSAGGIAVVDIFDRFRGNCLPLMVVMAPPRRRSIVYHLDCNLMFIGHGCRLPVYVTFGALPVKPEQTPQAPAGGCRLSGLADACQALGTSDPEEAKVIPLMSIDHAASMKSGLLVRATRLAWRASASCSRPIVSARFPNAARSLSQPSTMPRCMPRSFSLANRYASVLNNQYRTLADLLQVHETHPHLLKAGESQGYRKP